MPTEQTDTADNANAGNLPNQKKLYTKVQKVVFGSIGLAACAAVAVALGPVAATKQFVTRDGVSTVGYTHLAALISAVLVLVPVLAAFIAAVRGRTTLAAGVLAGAGLASVGLLVLDIQLLTRPINANRLELFRPISAGGLHLGWSIYLVVLGHLVAVIAGVGGFIALYWAAELDGHQEQSDASTAWSVEGAATEHILAQRIGKLLSTAVVIAGVSFAAGQFLAPLTSSDPVVLIYPSIQGPLWLAVAAVVLAFIAVGGAVGVLTLSSLPTASGILAGLGLALGQVAVVRVAIGLSSGEMIGAGIGSWVSLFGVVVLVLSAALLRPVVILRSRVAVNSNEEMKQSDSPASVRVSSISGYNPAFISRTQRVAGVLGLGAAALAVAGSLLPIASGSTEAMLDAHYGVRLVILAGILLAIASIWLFFSEFSRAAQPVVAVFALVLIGASAQIGQVIALALTGYRTDVGVGGFLIIGSWFSALATLIAVGVVGAAERDTDGVWEKSTERTSFSSVLAVATTLAVVALCLPLYRSSTQVAPWVGQFPPGVDVWMQLIFAGGLGVTAAVAVRSPALQARMLVLSMAAGIAVYLLGWPLTAHRFTDPSPAIAVIPGILAALLFVCAAFLINPDPLPPVKAAKKRR